mmetsp:Transcript_6067/g.8319  ORF Transcript_6067/g.8319 Transcript_6067/m.8319 type:complete len:201 (-) Transcript_6067:212-814(-)
MNILDMRICHIQSNEPLISSKALLAIDISESPGGLQMQRFLIGNDCAGNLAHHLFSHRRHVRSSLSHQPLLPSLTQYPLAVLCLSKGSQLQCLVGFHHLRVDLLHPGHLDPRDVGPRPHKEPFIPCNTRNGFALHLIREITNCHAPQSVVLLHHFQLSHLGRDHFPWVQGERGRPLRCQAVLAVPVAKHYLAKFIKLRLS